MHSWALADGKMLAKCVPPASDSGKISPRCAFGLSAVARFCRNAFSGCRPWQDLAVMRSRAAIRGSFFTSCVPEGASDGKSAPFLAAYRRRASKMSWLWQDIRAMHPKSPANGRSGMRRAKILPRRGPFRCAGPSDHARRADLAVVRRLNEKGSGKAKKLPAFRQEHVQK